jgi:hypothetical protein
VLKIAGSLGMLYATSEDGQEEEIKKWERVADWIQVIFGAESLAIRGFESIQVGELGLFLESSRLVVRPTNMRDALVYYACQRAASGTRVTPCRACGTPFLSGGSRGKGKKIASSKFCCDQCRWDFNNKQRRER